MNEEHKLMADNKQVKEPVYPAEVRLQSDNYIQGNVLAGFNKPHQVFLFLSFGEGERAQVNAKAWLAELTRPAAERITTTRHVTDFRVQRSQPNGKGSPEPKSVWMNVGLTHAGLVTLAPELAADLERYEAFRSGPAGRRKDGTTTADLLGDTGDSAPENWRVGKPGAEPHALLTIAADDRDELRARVTKERDLVERAALTVLLEEEGRALADGTEHFGFKDGVSQPGIRGFTRSVVRRGRMEDADHPGSPIIASGEFVLGRVRERRDDRAVEDDPPAPSWMWGGSFQVFRRLTQDLSLWDQEMRRLGPPLTAGELAAKAVGRRPDGKPLGPGGELGENDFDYVEDPLGYGTPRFAHIRKMNPRDHRVVGERTHRILRRGITFEAPYDAASAAKGEPVERGLLFNAFMASIEEQFEFLQRKWANNPRFPSVPLDTSNPEEATEDGVDPVVGAATGPCLLRVRGRADRALDFKRFVHTTGAVYAFAPSLLTLRGLAQGAAAARSKDATQLPGYPAAR